MYTIHPIELGTLRVPKDALTYRVDRDVEVTFPILAFLVTATDPDDDTVVLVDAGVVESGSPFLTDRGRDVGPPGGGPEPLLDGLAAHGVEPADVDVLVLTHLHHDHVANCDRFADAEVVVQRSEFEAARDPPPILAWAYWDEQVRTVEGMEPTVVDGDHRLRPGIDLLHTPGHSRGSQSVVVRTAAGPHALVGDVAYARHNLEPGRTSLVDSTGETVECTPMDIEYIPPGIHTDVEACYESVRRLRERVGSDGVLVPGHDPEHAERYPATGEG